MSEKLHVKLATSFLIIDKIQNLISFLKFPTFLDFESDGRPTGSLANLIRTLGRSCHFNFTPVFAPSGMMGSMNAMNENGQYDGFIGLIQNNLQTYSYLSAFEMIWIILSAALVVWLYSRYRRMTILQRNNIPTPPKSFIFGNLPDIRSDIQLKSYEKWIKTYGNVVGYYMGGNPLVMISDLELLKKIQIKDFHNFTDRNFPVGSAIADPKSNHHLIMQKGNKWKEARTIATPAFSSSKLRKMAHLIDNAIDNLIENVEKKGSKGLKEVNMYEFYQGLTLDVIGRCAFGVLTDVQANPDHPFIRAAKHLFNVKLGSGLLGLHLLFPEFSFIISPLRYISDKFLSTFGFSEKSKIFEYAVNIVAQRRKAIKKGETVQQDLLQGLIDGKLVVNAGSTSVDMLAMNKDENQNDSKKFEDNKNNDNKNKITKTLTDDEVAGNTGLFLEAGYETTSTLLGFVTHILVNNPDIQEQVRQEVTDLMQKDKKLDYNTVTELPYLDCVMNETMRMYPPIIAIVHRVANEDYPCDGFVIPKGCGVFVPVYHLHHNPEIWESPETFDPSRFEGSKKKEMHPSQFQPFGSGPRNCIGLRFGLLEAKLTLAKLLMKYRLEPGPNTELGDIEFESKIISIAPKKGVFVKAVPL